MTQFVTASVPLPVRVRYPDYRSDRWTTHHVLLPGVTLWRDIELSEQI